MSVCLALLGHWPVPCLLCSPFPDLFYVLESEKDSSHSYCAPKGHCDLTVIPVPFDLSWTHLTGLPLADQTIGEPRQVDILLGVDMFVSILCNSRRTGPVGSPIAVETDFGWVVCGGSTPSSKEVVSHHASVLYAYGNDILCNSGRLKNHLLLHPSSLLRNASLSDTLSQIIPAARAEYLSCHYKEGLTWSQSVNPGLQLFTDSSHWTLLFLSLTVHT